MTVAMLMANTVQSAIRLLFMVKHQTFLIKVYKQIYFLFMYIYISLKNNFVPLFGLSNYI